MRALLVYDVPGWAWYHKSTAIVKYLGSSFEKIEKIDQETFFRRNKKYMTRFDTIHCFSWMEATHLGKNLTTTIASYNYDFMRYDRSRRCLPRYKAIFATSKILAGRLKEQKMNDNVHVVQNGVDHTMFKPKYSKKDGPLVVGWCGKPSIGDVSFDRSLTKRDYNGYQSVLLPLVEMFKSDRNVEFKTLAAMPENAIPHGKLPHYYHGLDCFLNTSFVTGTPNPVFEAAACGLPIITTRTGAATELVKDGHNGFVIETFRKKIEANRVINDFYERIRWMSKNRIKARNLGKTMRKTIEKSWTWEKRSKKWEKYLKRYHFK